MCYMIVLSTDSNLELSQFNGRFLQFSKQLPQLPEESFLRYANKWYLGSKEGCSCDFRHLDYGNIALGFAEPIAWIPEQSESILATQEAVRVFNLLVRGGAKLDCIDIWAEDDQQIWPYESLCIDLNTVSETIFRFFERYHFNFMIKI